MKIITFTFLTTACVLLACPSRPVDPDHCIDAVTLTTDSIICGSEPIEINFGSITETTTPPNNCKPPPTPDFWLHVNVSGTSVGGIMIRRRIGTTIQAKAEVLYSDGCLPVGACCQSNMTNIGCFDFADYPNAIIIQDANPGDYYIRVWDTLSATSGTFVTSAHTLPEDINEWVICDSISGEGSGFRANQLIVEGGPNFTIPDFPPGLEAVDTCHCTDPPLLLLQGQNFDFFPEVPPITAQERPDVAGRWRNYKMDPRNLSPPGVCSVLSNCERTPYEPDPFNESSTKLAIIDSGINTGHEAFANAHWQNDAFPSIDDCVETDSIGYDFKDDEAIPEDSHGHGSWVAGTVVENLPSDIDLEIMSLRFYNDDDDYLFDAICAMHYAIDQKASTIVTSWGFRSDEYPVLLEDVIKRSAEHEVLIVCSAGNDTLDNDNIGKYPANAPSPNVISVAAFDEETKSIAAYSNFGESTVHLTAVDHVIAPSIEGTSLTSVDSVFGTSISAPRVARTAAIMKARHPFLTAAQIRKCIINKAEKLPELEGLVSSGGVLDHEEALKCADLLGPN